MTEAEYKAALKNLLRDVRIVILHLQREIESLHTLDYQSMAAAFKDEALKLMRAELSDEFGPYHKLIAQAASKLAADRDLIGTNLKEIRGTRDKTFRLVQQLLIELVPDVKTRTKIVKAAGAEVISVSKGFKLDPKADYEPEGAPQE